MRVTSEDIRITENNINNIIAPDTVQMTKRTGCGYWIVNLRHVSGGETDIITGTKKECYKGLEVAEALLDKHDRKQKKVINNLNSLLMKANAVILEDEKEENANL